MDSLVEKYSGYVGCWVAVSWAPLDVRLLRAARAVEMQFFGRRGVCAESLPEPVAKSTGGKDIQGRLVATNKGDSAVPDYRSRFVGNGCNTGVDATLSAPHPHLRRCHFQLVMRRAIGMGELASCSQT